MLYLGCPPCRMPFLALSYDGCPPSANAGCRLSLSIHTFGCTRMLSGCPFSPLVYAECPQMPFLALSIHRMPSDALRDALFKILDVLEKLRKRVQYSLSAQDCILEPRAWRNPDPPTKKYPALRKFIPRM